MTGMGGERDDETWEDAEVEPIETERLALDDADERLPWLESGDDADDGDEGSETGHTLRLGLLALAALAAIVLGIYWITHRNPDPALTPDGSLVAAEPQPYKEAPKDPGGKTFDGTGDTSFAVSEGQSKPAQMAAGQTAAPAPEARPSTAAAAAAGGVGVQVGAFSSKAAAEAGWAKLTGSAGSALSGVSHRVIEGKADNGTVFRLQAVAPNADAAQALCGKLKAAGISCQVK
ncbi:SPOR domain-containing protein [Novosphingobium sp.]|uniref:SPOR domain-containing protein n=1 Tax=Novosphingobium sp. TaxID=1874826 RepID=UPI00286BC5C8|nr:SPOR domain-containing protein [Novosphingobium sp.]